jgi:hypothetical protein
LEEKMKKTIIVGLIATLALAGCDFEPDRNYPEPMRTTTSTPQPELTKPTQGSKPDPVPTKNTPEEQPTKETPKPEPAPTTSGAETPATQFAKRWGEKYPSIPEYAILKAANGVCAVTQQYPDWTDNALAKAALYEVVKGFGLAENDAVEFTQDAQQNYCASVSNPT